MTTFYHGFATKIDEEAGGDEHVKSVFGMDKEECVREIMHWVGLRVLEKYAAEFEYYEDLCGRQRGSESATEAREIAKKKIDRITDEMAEVSAALLAPIKRSNLRVDMNTIPPQLIGEKQFACYGLYLYKLSLTDAKK